MSGPESRLPSSLGTSSRVASAVVIFLGCLGLGGWILDIPTLKSGLPGLATTMKPNTAVAFVLAGVSLWLLQDEGAARRKRRMAQACASIVALVGLLTLGEYPFNLDFGIDELLIGGPAGAVGTPLPGRMAPTAALNFLVLGLALLLLDTPRGLWPAHFLTLLCASISSLVLLGYLYGAPALLYNPPTWQVAVNTLLAFMALSLGLLFARPERGLMARATSAGAGGVLGRRLLPALLAVPVIAGLVRLAGERAGLYGTEFGLALMVFLSIAALAAVGWATAGRLERLDEQHRRAAEAQRAIVESAPSAFVIVGGDGRIVTVNPQAEKMFGYGREELAGQPIESLIPERSRDAHRAHRAAYSSAPRFSPMGVGLDLTAWRKDGSKFPAEVMLSPLETEEGLLVIALLGGMAVMLRRLLGEHIDLAIVPGAGLGRVKADPSQVEQIFLNLATNARDAMPEGGRLTLETTNVELDEAYTREHPRARPGPHVMVAVSDTGGGMDAETQAPVFEPFFTTKEAGKGTGLGLATVYGIVKQSGGYIWVYSEPGRGTTFKIYLPRVEEAAEAEEAERALPAAPGGFETVLVAEDEAELRELAREILGSRGYTVLEATNGREALDISGRLRGEIHLVLTDVVMPEMGGLELALRLASSRPETKVLYVSGYTAEALTRDGVLSPGTALLPKPFTPDALARKVREVLDAPRS